MSDNKRQDDVKEEKRQMKRIIFFRTIREDARNKTKELEELFGRKLNAEERKGILKDAKARAIRKVVIATAFATLGIGSFAGVVKVGEVRALQEGKSEKEVIEEENTNIDDLEDEQAINAIAKTSAEKFREGLQNFVNYNKEIKQNVIEEIEKLGTKEALDEYLHIIVAENYNKTHNEKVNSDSVYIRRTRPTARGEILYKDFAENGDVIIRIGNRKTVEERGYSTLDEEKLMLIIGGKKEDGAIGETAVYYKEQYVPVYDMNEEIKEQETNSLCQIGDLVHAGIDFRTTAEEENSLENKKWERTQKFIETVTKYRLNNAKEVSNFKVEESKESKRENIQSDEER